MIILKIVNKARLLVEKFLAALDKFFYSKLYLVLVGIIIYLCWYFNQSVLGMVILLSLLSITMVAKEDITPALPILLMIIFVVSKDDILNTNMPAIICFGIITGISVIIHFIIYPTTYKLGKLFFPLVGVSIALIVGGALYLSPKQYLEGLIFIFTLGIFMLVLYFYIFNNIKPAKDFNLPKYLCMTLCVAGVVVALECLTTIIKLDRPIIEVVRDIISIGWTTRNGTACMLLVCFPACFYLGIINKKLWGSLYCLIGLFIFSVILLSSSRAGFIGAAIVAPCVVIYSLVKSKNKWNILIALLVYAIVVGFAAAYMIDNVIDVIKKIWENGFTSSGRSDLYKEAIDLFKNNLIFGAGLGYKGTNYAMSPWCIYWFHSTFFQVIGSLGIIGIVAYAYFYVQRILVLFKKINNPFNIIMIFSVLGFEIHSLIDVGTFAPFPFLFSVILISIIVEINNYHDSSGYVVECNKKIKKNNLLIYKFLSR